MRRLLKAAAARVCVSDSKPLKLAPSVIDVDIMIGELDAVGRGLGSDAIRLVAELGLSDPTVPFVIGCARRDNLAPQQAFAKAGFRKDREFDDVPNGLHVLMVRRRPPGQSHPETTGAPGHGAAADRLTPTAELLRWPGRT